MESFPFEQEFVDYLEVELGFMPGSIETYSLHLGQFSFFLQLNYFPEGIEVKKIDPEHVRSYLYFLKQEKMCKSTTRNNKLAALSTYFDFLKVSGHLGRKKSPVKNLRKAKEPFNLPVHMTKSEAELFLKATWFDTEFPYRDYAIMKLFLQTGIRLAELVGLGKSDLDLNSGSIFVRGKGAKERILPLTESTAEALRIQLEKRPPFIDDGGYMFLNSKKYPMEKRGVQLLFHRVRKKAGIEKPGLTVHSLRHTCFTLLLKEGVDIVTLQELAGHKDIDSTSIYTHVVNEDMRKAMERHPLG